MDVPRKYSYALSRFCQENHVDLYEYPAIVDPTELLVMKDPVTGGRANRTISFWDMLNPSAVEKMLCEMLAEIRGTEADGT